jgi:hypothetical protein
MLCFSEQIYPAISPNATFCCSTDQGYRKDGITEKTVGPAEVWVVLSRGVKVLNTSRNLKIAVYIAILV